MRRVLMALAIGVFAIASSLSLQAQDATSATAARQAAREELCRRNMEQVGLGIQMYLSSHGGEFPLLVLDSTPASTNVTVVAPASAPAQADAAKIQALINGLGSDDYTVREQSQKDLAALGLAAKDEIQKATGSDDLEVRQRAEQLMIGIRKAEQAVKNDSMKKNYLWGFAMDDGMTERPVVAGSIVLAAGPNGKVHALDIKTGKEVWATVDAPPAKTVPPASGPTSSPASSKPATMPASSPATAPASGPATSSAPAIAPAGVAIVVQGKDRMQAGQGPVVMNVQFGGLAAGPAGAPSKAPVQAGAPVVCDDMVIYCDGKQVNAASLNGGKLAWSFPGNNMPAAAGGLVFVGSAEGGLTALDIKTGGQVWKADDAMATVGRPAVGEGLVCIVGIDKKAGGNAAGVVMGPGGMMQGSLGTHVQAFDAKAGKQLFKKEIQGCRSVYVKGGMVIVRSVNAVAALDLKDGKTVWTQNMPSAPGSNIRMVRGNAIQFGGPGVAGPAADDMLITDDIVCGIRGDEIVALNIKTGKESWQTRLNLRDIDADSETEDTPAQKEIRARRVMARGGMQIQAQMIVGPNGQMVFNPTFVGDCTPAVDNGTVYVAAMNGIHAIDIKTGQRLWHFRTAYVPNGKLTLVDGVLYFGTAGQVQQSSGSPDVLGLNALKVK